MPGLTSHVERNAVTRKRVVKHKKRWTPPIYHDTKFNSKNQQVSETNV